MREYSLPKLGYDNLAPFLSSEQLKIHHEKHHKSYVDAVNNILQEMSGKDIKQKRVLKDFSFNIGGHLLHSLFWKNLSDQKKEMPQEIKDSIEENFNSFSEFKEKFSSAALTVEGSGWAALTICRETGNLIICQIEKHNVNIYPHFEILLILDLFEHAYYIDYRNKRNDYIDNFWPFVDWQEVNNRFTHFNKWHKIEKNEENSLN